MLAPLALTIWTLVLVSVLYQYFGYSTGTLYLFSVGNDIIECRYAQFLLILAKVGWRLEFRLLNQLLLEIYYRFVTTEIFTGRKLQPRIASSRGGVITPQSVLTIVMVRVRSRSRLDLD